IPAQFTTISARPNFCCTAFAIAATESGLDTSQTAASALRPAASTSFTVSRPSAISATVMCTPSSARRFAKACPIPLAPPVMTATLSLWPFPTRDPPSIASSIPKHPADNSRIALISAVPGKRLVVPELVRRRTIRQFEQQRGADVVGAVGRADRAAEDEAIAVGCEVGFVGVQVLAEEFGRAGLGSGAQKLLQTLAAIVGGALAKTVRPAVDFDALIDAGFVQRLVGDKLVRRRAIVELHEERGAQKVAAVVGYEVAVADDALAGIFDVAFLLRQERTPGRRRPRLVPAIDRPLRRLGAVIIFQRLALQSIARIARQISGRVAGWHFASKNRAVARWVILS